MTSNRTFEVVGQDFGCVLARTWCSLTAASENAVGALVAQPRSCE